MSFKSTRTPYIEATTVLNVKSRSKRRTREECALGTGGKCCKKSLRIQFRNIPGLGELYTIPGHFNAYYCTGSCASGKFYNSKLNKSI